MVPFRRHLDAVLASVAEHAEALDCRPEIQRARQIAEETSADRQLAIFEKAFAGSVGMHEAVASVVDWIADVTAGRLS